MSPKTFKILEIEIPEQYTKVRLSLEEFHRLAEKLDFVSVLENDDTLIFLEPEGEIIYFAKKYTAIDYSNNRDCFQKQGNL